MGLFGPNITKLEKKSDINGLIKAIKNSNPKIKKDAIKALERNSDDKALVTLFNYL